MVTIESELGALADSGVRFVIVGGVAVVLHGHTRTTVDIDGHAIRIASIDHLIQMKRLAGRTQDLADIEMLEFAHKTGALKRAQRTKFENTWKYGET